MRFATAQSSKPLGGFARNEGLESQAYELRLFLYTCELYRASEKLIIDVERRPHMHEYAWSMHMLSSIVINRHVRSITWLRLRDDVPTRLLLSFTPLRHGLGHLL